MKLFDTHCHLAGEELLPQASVLLGRAIQEQVMGVAIIAADEPSLRAVPGLVKKLRAEAPDALVVGSAGIHPHEAESIPEELWELVVQQAQSAEGIGETGLDYHYDHADRATQRELFSRHIELACGLKKPLIIHCREAGADVLELLDCASVRNHPKPGILHCFTEDLPTAKKLLDLNFVISFSGILSFKNAQNLRDIAAELPSSHLLIETDSPWLAPLPHRGKKNEPAFVRRTFEVLCQVRKESPEELAQILWRNSCRIFGLGASS